MFSTLIMISNVSFSSNLQFSILLLNNQVVTIIYLSIYLSIIVLYIIVTVHTAGRDEEHADEEILQNNSFY